MTMIVGCCTMQHLVIATLAFSLVLAGLASTATISTEAGVFRRELMPVVAVGTSNVLIAQSVDASGAPSPVGHVGGVFDSPLRGGKLFPHGFSVPLPPAGSTSAASFGLKGVLGSELMSMIAVCLGGIWVGAVSSSVKVVIGRRVPAQVLQAVVGSVAVAVAGFHAWRAGADESLQHQTVNSPVPTGDSHPAVLLAIESNFHVTTPPKGAPIFDSSIKASYTSEIADFVKVDTRDGFPDFCHGSKCTVGSGSAKGGT